MLARPEHPAEVASLVSGGQLQWDQLARLDQLPNTLLRFASEPTGVPLLAQIHPQPIPRGMSDQQVVPEMNLCKDEPPRRSPLLGAGSGQRRQRRDGWDQSPEVGEAGKEFGPRERLLSPSVRGAKKDDDSWPGGSANLSELFEPVAERPALRSFFVPALLASSRKIIFPAAF